MKELTILTLFGGRWHTLEPYLHGLLNLDWPVKGLKLLWYTNAERSFVECLRWHQGRLKRKGYRIHLVPDPVLPPSGYVFSEGADVRSFEHANTIAALYDAAWQHVETDDILALEDDVLIPSHALKRLARLLDEQPKASIAVACVFSRHPGNMLFVWQLASVPVYQNGSVNTRYELHPFHRPWGIQKVSAGGLSCTLIRRSRLPKALASNGLLFKAKNPFESQDLLNGCDIVLCLENQRYGGEVWCDFDVRPLHIDSKGGVH